MVRFHFNTQWRPSAPLVYIATTNSGDPVSTVENVVALLDTGADCTVVPVAFVADLDLKTTGFRWIEGVGSEPSPAQTYSVRVNFRAHAHQHLLNVVASESEPFVMLGRDFLNSFRIFYDGPRQLLEIT